MAAALKSLTFTTLPKLGSNPVLDRRAKVITRLEEQKSLLADPTFTREPARRTARTCGHADASFDAPRGQTTSRRSGILPRRLHRHCGASVVTARDAVANRAEDADENSPTRNWCCSLPPRSARMAPLNSAPS